MHGIIKSSHQKFCDWLQDLKVMQPTPDIRLNELENELQSVFMSYQQKMDELKQLIHIYENKQKAIRNEIKKIRKLSLF